MKQLLSALILGAAWSPPRPMRPAITRWLPKNSRMAPGNQGRDDGRQEKVHGVQRPDDAYLGASSGIPGIGRLWPPDTPEKQKEEMERPLGQKQDAAIEEVTAVTERLNKEMRAWKAENVRGEEALLIRTRPMIQSLRGGLEGNMPMLTPAQAETLIEQHLTCLPIESLPLTQAAGAVLRENIYAERDHPPFDRVAMDGIALSAAAAATTPGACASPARRPPAIRRRRLPIPTPASKS